MVRLIITPEIIDKTSWERVNKLVGATRNMPEIGIFYAPTLDAQTTAQGLKERIARLTEIEGSREKISVRVAELSPKGNEEIIKYLESRADTEAQYFMKFKSSKTYNLIFVLEQKVSDTLPNEIWTKVLNPGYGGIPKLKQGQAVLFNFNKSCAQSALNVYTPYSCTPLF